MQPAVRPRPLGGFNQGIGDFNEHLDENAMQAAVQQKALGQQATSAAQNQTGGSALQMQQPQGQEPAAQPPKPRELGTIPEELVKRPVADIIKGLQSFFDINALLGINPEQDDPQTQARKKQMLQRWQGLNNEQQEYAKKVYQQNLQKKEQAEKEEQMKKEEAEKRKAQTLVMPSSPSKGAVGPGGQHKPKAVQKLEQDRKSLGGPASAN